MREKVYQNQLWLRGKNKERTAFSLEGHDKGKRRGITVKIERNGGVQRKTQRKIIAK